MPIVADVSRYDAVDTAELHGLGMLCDAVFHGFFLLIETFRE